MRRLLFIFLVLISQALGVFVVSDHQATAARPLWQKFVPQKQVEADPEAEYTLSQERGPWLVLAASFSGEQAEQQARDLILELRRDFGLTAFYYGMTFQMDENNLGLGIDKYGSKIRRRYQRGNQVREHAVLVGEFPSIDDPEARKLLKKLKQITPASLATEEGESTSQSLAAVRKFHDLIKSKKGASDKKGPMGHAFMTRNPMLPKDYFVPQGIDNDVAKWNEGLELTLMKCPGRYSVRVATFRGRTSLESNDAEKSGNRVRKAKKDEPLVVAAKNAHLMAVALREKGWEAYEFHDRQESYVAIGSFNEGQIRPDGQIALSDRDAQIIMNTFGASSPNNIFNRPAQQDVRLENQRKEQFMSMFQNNKGQVAEGFHPKRFVGLPMDIYPQAVRVPRRSVSSAYARK